MPNLRRPLMLSLMILIASASVASALDTNAIRQQLSAFAAQNVTGWRYLDKDITDGQALDVNTSSWKIGDPEFTWSDAATAWLRKTIVIPERVGAFPIAGSKVTLCVGVDDGGIIYVNGERAQPFHWEDGRVVLTENARPGDRYLVAIKGINTGGPGRLLTARLEYDVLQDVQVQSLSLVSDLDFARRMAESAQGDEKARITAMVNNSWSKIDTSAIAAGDKKALLASLAAARKTIEPLANGAKQLTCHLVGHAHIDMNWLWLWPETVDVCRNTFTSATNFMDQYPQFCFSQSQPSTYLATEENFPELFRKIQKYVKEGRWEITGGTWVEGDMNMASGESIVRQILYAKRYFKEKFGVEPRICWEPDTFGHAWTIPQILKKSDIDYYYFVRCGKGQPLFWWQSPDGSRVLAFNDGSYGGGINEGMAKEAQDLNKSLGVKDSLVVYGVGDHGGGPTRESVKKALELQQRTLLPTVKFDTFSNYMKTVLAQKQDFPVINDELNFIFQGCYTTHADIKKWNRESENLLPTAEALSSVASLYGGSYPSADFVSAWRDTCFNQFHDIFDGSAIHGSYEYSKQLFDSATGKARNAMTSAVDKLTSQIDTAGAGIPVVVFNQLSWARTDVVRIADPFKSGETAAKVVDSEGDERPCAINGDVLEFVARDVPAMGYKVFWLVEGGSKTRGRVYAKGSTVENEFFRVRVDETSGTVVSVYDKINNREIVPQGKPADQLQVLMEKPHGMSAWNIGEISSTKDLNEAEVEPCVSNGVSASVRIDHHFGDSTLAQDIILYDGVPRIDIKLTADWREQGTKDKDAPMLKVAFPVDLKDPKATFEVPFGSIERPRNGNEVPAQKWIDLSQDDYGVSLLNDCKYGHDVKDTVMRLTLLRSSYDPDPNPDQGIQEMTYSLYPHTGTWREALTIRRGYELNNPLIPAVVEQHQGTLPKARSFVSVSPDNVTVSSLKMAEDGDGFILRFYEWAGTPCTVKIMTSLPVKSYVETNLIEREIGEKTPIKDGEIEMPLGKYEIKTVKLLK